MEGSLKKADKKNPSPCCQVTRNVISSCSQVIFKCRSSGAAGSSVAAAVLGSVRVVLPCQEAADPVDTQNLVHSGVTELVRKVLPLPVLETQGILCLSDK